MGTTRRWLAACDAAPPAEHAVRLASTLARRAGVCFEVVGVETAGLPALTGAGPGLARCDSSQPMRWLRGIPGVEIARSAEEGQAELVVLGRRRRSLQEPRPLGRTSDTLLRRRDGPCLLIPEGVEQLQRMVLALDGTRRGLGILAPAAEFASAFGAETTSVHVRSDDLSTISGDAAWADPASQRIQAALSEFPTLGGAESLQVLAGAPVPRLLSFMADSHADVLVLGVRRGGPPGEMGSGHVGRDLLRTVPVAILTIPI